jgi:hypothetical protein
MPQRQTLIRAGLAIAAVSFLCLLFIGSYAGALHDPRPHNVPIAVEKILPSQKTAQLDATPELRVIPADDRADALQLIDERKAYGAITIENDGIHLIESPASSAAVNQFLHVNLKPQLEKVAGFGVTEEVVHPLPASDGRGLVGFYTAIGWVVAGYLGATLLGLAFGPSTARRDVAWRIAAIGVLGLVMGIGGALISAGIAGYDHGTLGLMLIGFLTVIAVGATTLALQGLLGMLGTGVAILIFVVLGNPSAGGAYAGELLPGLWRVLGQLIPTGAATTAIRNVVYFPDASVWGQIAVLLILFGVSAAVAIGLFGRGIGMTDAEHEASAGAFVA